MLVHGKGSLCTIKKCEVVGNGEMGVGVQRGAEVDIHFLVYIYVCTPVFCVWMYPCILSV